MPLSRVYSGIPRNVGPRLTEGAFSIRQVISSVNNLYLLTNIEPKPVELIFLFLRNLIAKARLFKLQTDIDSIIITITQ